MKSVIRTRLAVFGGAAALAAVVAGGGIAASDMDVAAGPTNSSVNVAPAPPTPPAQRTAANPGGVQVGTLVGCVGGLNC